LPNFIYFDGILTAERISHLNRKSFSVVSADLTNFP